MAQEGLQIQISANVQQAVTGLKQVEQQTVKTGSAVQKTGQVLGKQLTQGTNQANVALVNFGRVVQDAPFGLIGIANNIDPLLSSFQQLKQQTGSSGAAFKALASSLAGPAGIAIAVSAVTSALIAFGPEIKRAIGGANEFTDAISNASEAQASAAVKVFAYVTAVKEGGLTTDQLRTAQKELIKINPAFNKAFADGKVNVDALNTALDDTVKKIFNTIKVSAATEVLEKEFKKLADQILNNGKNLSTLQQILAGQGGRFAGGRGRTFATENLANAEKEIANFGERIKAVYAKLDIDLSQVFKETEEKTPKPIKKAADAVKEFSLTFADFRNNLNNAFDESLEDSDKRIDLFINNSQKAADALRKFNDEQLRLQGIDPTGATEPPAPFSGTPLLFDQKKIDDAVARYKKLNEQTKALQDTINNGINAGIDQFFNALANNQDPFAALQQSVKRLVAELAAAVVKSFILKNVLNVAAPGLGEIANIPGAPNFNNVFVNTLRLRP